MTAAREAMLRALEHTVIPLLTSRGFVVYPLSSKERASAELRRAFPFGYMKRKKGPDLQLLEIQFDKRSARFVISVGVAPSEGVDLPWGHFAQTDLGVSGLPEAYRLYSRTRFMRWFSPAWFGGDHGARAMRTAERVVAVYPEIEAWFATGAVGPHMRRSTYPFPPASGKPSST